MKHLSKTLIATVGLLSALLTAPIASAGSVHLNLPGISIGVHDGHRYKDNRYRSHRSNDRRYYKKRKYQRHYDNNDYYYDRSSRNSKYDRRYNNNNYYGGNSNYDRRDYRSNRSQVCPTRGYTPRYDRNRNCYKHKGHFHCS